MCRFSTGCNELVILGRSRELYLYEAVLSKSHDRPKIVKSHSLSSNPLGRRRSSLELNAVTPHILRATLTGGVTLLECSL